MNQSTKKVLKKISATTIETISQISPEELEAHDIIQQAKVSGFVCPILWLRGRLSRHRHGAQQENRNSYFFYLFQWRTRLQRLEALRSALQP